jgi:hypothetical protein
LPEATCAILRVVNPPIGFKGGELAGVREVDLSRHTGFRGTERKPRELPGAEERIAEVAEELQRGIEGSGGKHSTGKGCLYIKKLSDVDLKVLEELIVKGVKAMEKQRVR